MLSLPQPALPPHSFRASFQLRMGGGTGADGFSFSYGDLPTGPIGELGAGDGLRICWRTHSLERLEVRHLHIGPLCTPRVRVGAASTTCTYTCTRQVHSHVPCTHMRMCMVCTYLCMRMHMRMHMLHAHVCMLHAHVTCTCT